MTITGEKIHRYETLVSEISKSYGENSLISRAALSRRPGLGDALLIIVQWQKSIQHKNQLVWPSRQAGVRPPKAKKKGSLCRSEGLYRLYQRLAN